MKLLGFGWISTRASVWMSAVLLMVAIRAPASAAGLDRNKNGLNDVWELLFQGGALLPGTDPDGDGFSNAAESDAGTDPADAGSYPSVAIQRWPGSTRLGWASVPGKRYTVLGSQNLALWTNSTPLLTTADASTFEIPAELNYQFFRLSIDDVDSDGDGVTDYEERSLGFNPGDSHTDRFAQSDFQRITNSLASVSVINISALDPLISERWPDPGLVVVRRRGGLAPVTVNIEVSGTAVPGADFTIPSTTSVVLPAGKREVWVEILPIADSADAEDTETITITLQPGSGYTLGTNLTATLTLENQTDSSGPSAKEAARFLIQAGFGPDQDSAADADHISENVEEVMALGIAGWLEDQFTRPVGKLQPFVDWGEPRASQLQLYGDLKSYSWWNRAMGAPRLTPDDTETVQPDPLRQRVALALSEILVISDRLEDLAVVPSGMANYYDLLLEHSFGNYEDLLLNVSLHPCMGIYLSHLGNRKADTEKRVYPDENYAREIMQLFTIGLWELNPDGTRRLDDQGQPIPTYSNEDITELARVFTGLAFGGTNTQFGLWPRNFSAPMKMWDQFHDCEAKTLLRGLQLPARTASAGNTGTAGMADVRAAVSNLFHHPNVPPFISKHLIQRFVTSNPSTGYVGRVAGVFANNGAGVRGDLKAVIKAILVDPEARDGQMMANPRFGKLREPFLKFVNFARAFNASSSSGIYALDNFTLDHVQEPMKAPSVFNFFLPGYSPPGALTDAGMVAPEFQIINASSAIGSPNHYWNSILGGLHRWGVGNAAYNVRLNLDQEFRMVVPDGQVTLDVPSAAPFDPDPLLRRLDLTLTGGQLTPRQFQIIRETLERLPRPSWKWHHEYLRVAIYLVVTSPEFSVMK